MRRQFLLVSLLAGIAAAGAAEPFIWTEAEAPQAQTMTRHPWWYDKVKRDQFSGGDFISNWNDKQAGEATYAIQATVDKDYVLWVRANPIGTSLSYQLDAGPWTLIDTKAAEDTVNVAEDGKPDLRFIAWLRAGQVKLTRGAHRVAFRMHSDNNNHGMLDCFVFADTSFTPRGTRKPGADGNASGAPGAETWAFHPPHDEFAPEALLDLRGLNERFAGEHGFVRRSTEGSEFVLGDGRPARFWAVNDGAFDSDLARHARFLAKRGINMVRFFSNLTPNGGDLLAVDAADRARVWKAVAAVKKEGIYVTFCPYWAGASRAKPAQGYLDDAGNHNWGLLFFDPKLQAAYKSWMKQMLTEKNPHTGIALAQDPALAVIEIQNEDSLLFWTAQGIKGAARKELRRQFGAFAAKKYGSLASAKAGWGNAAPSADQDAPDEVTQGEAGLYLTWQLTQRGGSAGQQQRCADQMQFLTETMRRFNQMIGDYLKHDLGCQQLVNAGNWRTADNVTMLDAERWSYTANEVMAVNRYYDGVHQGANNGWAICENDRFTDDSVLSRPRELPLTLKQVAGFPIMITESSWVPPLSHQSEGPFLVAAYQSLTGVGAYFWFQTGDQDWRQPGSANGFLPSEGKWVCATPMLMGQWPAAALMYRMGYIKQGAPVVSEQRTLADLWQRRTPIIAEDAGYDPNRDQDNRSKESNVKEGVNPLAYLVGPVVAKYGETPAPSQIVDLAPYLDGQRKTVRSVTGEITLNYGERWCRLDTPKAQGVAGFLQAAGDCRLTDVEIRSTNDYATVLVVAMDNQPLKQSGKVLVQVGTTERPAGWKTKPVTIDGRAGEQVVSFGRAPWMIVRAAVEITIGNPSLKTARTLDANGMPTGDIPLVASGGRRTFRFPADALYVVLE